MSEPTTPLSDRPWEDVARLLSVEEARDRVLQRVAPLPPVTVPLPEALGLVCVEDVSAFVLGGHGDTMVPLSRYSTVAGIPITELLPADRIAAIEERTANGGAEIVGLLKSGSAYYAPAASIVAMVDAVLLDKKRVIPCSVLLQGEYGVDGLFVGVPIKLGAAGMEQIIEITLSDDERAALRRSADAVKELVETMARLGREDA